MVRILVIEDEEPILDNIAETLEINEFEVIKASNGIDGVEYAHEFHPDIILCDIMMSGMNGYDVLDHVRTTPDIALTPFIFLTAKSDRDSLRYGMELGADDYIPKPFTSEELLSAIRTRIGRFTDIEHQADAQLTATKKQLAHVISHELRTPLTSINMAIQLMSQQLDFLSASDITDLVGTLGHGTNRLNRLVEQISLFVEAKSGLITNEKIGKISRPESLWSLIIGSIRRANNFIHRENNVFVNFDSNDGGIEIPCYNQLMTHALAEIIANAIVHSPENGQVDITVKQYDKGVRIRIQDSGKGMTEDQIELALQDFSQVDRERQEQQGVGVGLPLAKIIIESHDGRIDLQSRVNEGTIVNIYLPY